MDIEEWHVVLTRELATGRVSVALYGVEESGQYNAIADAEFGPFDTAQDVCRWLVRHWAPRARLPLR